MRVQYMSDLHLEGGVDLDVKNVGGDVLRIRYSTRRKP